MLIEWHNLIFLREHNVWIRFEKWNQGLVPADIVVLL